MIPTQHRIIAVFTATGQQPQRPVTQEQYLTSPLLRNYELQGIVCQEFKLTPEEETLLYNIAFESKLAPSLSLIHIFFFHLIRVINSIKLSLKPDNYHRLIEALKKDYRQFLTKGTVSIWDVSDLFPIEDPSDLADQMTISSKLSETFALLDKIGSSPHALPILNNPYRTLVGFEHIYYRVSQNEFFLNHSYFFQFYFSSLLTQEKFQEYRRDLSICVVAVLGLAQGTEQALKEKYSSFQNLFGHMTGFPLLTICFEDFADYIQILQQRNDPPFALLQAKSLLSGKNELHQILSRSTEVDDPLSILKANGFVSYDSHLSESERQTLNSLMHEITLDSEIPFSTVLFMGIFKRLDDLAQNSPTYQEVIKEAQKELAAIYIQYFITQTLETKKCLEDSFLTPPEDQKFLMNLSNLAHILRDQIESLRKNLSPNKSSQGRRRQAQDQKRDALIKKIDKEIIPIVSLIEKLLSFQPPASFKGEVKGAILDRGLIMIPQAKLIDEVPQNPSMLKMYCRLLRLGNEVLNKREQVIIQFNFAWQMGDIEKLQNRPTEQQYKQFAQRHLIEMTELLQLAANKNNFLQQSTAIAFLILTTTILRLAERHLLPKGTLTTNACMQRLHYNVNQYKSDQATSSFSSDHRLQKTSIFMQDNLNNWSQLLDLVSGHNMMGSLSFLHPMWYQVFMGYKDSIENCFKEVTGQLAEIKIALIQEYQSQWSGLSHDDLQKVNVGAIKDDLFKQGLCLVRPLMMISDMQAILLTRHLSEEAELIPYQLADIMELDELDQILEKLIAAQTQRVVEQASPAALPEPQPKLEGKKAKKKQVRALPPPSAHPKAQVNQPQPEPTPLRNLRKSRQVLAWLHEHSFMEARQRGSHHILQNQAGAQVVVPNNSNLPLRTRRGIEKQFRAARDLNRHEE